MPSYDWKGPPRYLNKRYRSPRRVAGAHPHCRSAGRGVRGIGRGRRKASPSRGALTRRPEDTEDELDPRRTSVRVGPLRRPGERKTHPRTPPTVTIALRATAANIRPYKGLLQLGKCVYPLKQVRATEGEVRAQMVQIS